MRISVIEGGKKKNKPTGEREQPKGQEVESVGKVKKTKISSKKKKNVVEEREENL